jgi:predicted Holliday junction resolvase-like endonuclease
LFDPAHHPGGGMEIAVIILLVIVIALSAVMLYREFQHVSQRMGNLEERVKKLETASRKRMPWDAMDKLLNARAALNREKEERQIGINFIENAEAWLNQVMAEGTKRGDEQK